MIGDRTRPEYCSAIALFIMGQTTDTYRLKLKTWRGNLRREGKYHHRQADVMGQGRSCRLVYLCMSTDKRVVGDDVWVRSILLHALQELFSCSHHSRLGKGVQQCIEGYPLAPAEKHRAFLGPT